MRYFDTIIVGQGFAGTALAWQLEFAGRQSYLVIDREPPVTASRIAAGLITPITGQRLVKTEHYEERFREAEAFYRRVEDELSEGPPTRRSRSAPPTTSPSGGDEKSGADNEASSNTNRTHLPPGGGGRSNEVRAGGGGSLRVFHRRPMLRLFQNEREQQIFEAKQHAEFAGLVEEHPHIDPAEIAAPLGGFTMTTAGQLDAQAYLNRSRSWFAYRNSYEAAELDVETDLLICDDGIRIPKLDIRANRVIFCQGFLNQPNLYFAEVPFQAAQGDILTLRIPGFHEHRVIHRGIWLAPAGDDLYRCGSTYSWEPFDGLPSAAARAELERKLKEFLKLPYEVIDHRAAVRPIIRESRPRLGLHPQHPQLGFFNGLGSKGALLAPHFAAMIVRHVFDGTSLD